MNLDKHLHIIFNEVKINSELTLIDLWQSINTTTKDNFDLNSPIGFKRMVRSYFLFKYFNSVRHLDGSILEVGVFRGFSGLFLTKLENELNIRHNNKIFLIDSFEGLSKINDNDLVSDKNVFQHQEGHFKVDYHSVKDLFKDYENVSVIKGWIPEVFHSLKNDNLYKYVHIDVDLYEPTISTLNYIFDKIVKGGVVITDDFDSSAFPGNRKAWQEFFIKKNILTSISLPSGQAVYIKDS